MKIIDLLNKIANGEEVPSKIKYPSKEKEYIYDLDIQDYRCDDTLIFNTLFSNYRTKFFINDEVEIIEEDKKIEKLNLDKERKTIGNEQIRAIDYLLEAEINELIDKVNNLQNK